MKSLIITVLLLCTSSYITAQSNENQLLKDQCNCIEEIATTITITEQYDQLMDCALQSYKKHKSYTDEIVRAYFRKDEINGKDVLKYHEEVVEELMIKSCKRYDMIITQLLNAKQ
ncbi:hypothetical protein [Aquimarina rhabdastrellae]